MRVSLDDSTPTMPQTLPTRLRVLRAWAMRYAALGILRLDLRSMFGWIENIIANAADRYLSDVGR